MKQKFKPKANKSIQLFKYSIAFGILLSAILIPRSDSNKQSNLIKPTKVERIVQRDSMEFEKTRDPKTGSVPRQRLAKARAYSQKLINEKAAIPGINWDERGPNNVGGRTRALMFDPNDATNKKVFAGSVGGGLWYTNDITDPMESWNKVDDFWDNLAITCLASDPSNSMVFYAGTGEGFLNFDAIQGDGIWKSTDGGTTWNQLTITNDNASYHKISDLIVLANGHLLVTTNTDLFKSTNGGASFSSIATGTFFRDLELASNGDVYSTTAAGSIVKGTNNGTNWSFVLQDANAGRIELACAPSDKDVVYAVASIPYGSPPTHNDIAWFKKSIDGGVTWNDISIPMYKDQLTCLDQSHFTRGQANYDLILHVSKTNADFVIAGGIDLHRSKDGGATWESISYWTGSCDDYVHADQHQIIDQPGSQWGIIVGNDGGVYYTVDSYSGNPDFIERNKDYNVTQYYACAISPTAGSQYVLAGAQDNGTQKHTVAGINSTTEVSGGDGAFCHIDDNELIQITAYIRNRYYVSLNGGTSFVSRSFNGDGRFINPTDYDSGEQKLYAANTDGTYFRWNDPATAGTSADTVTVTNFPAEQVSSVLVSPNVDKRVYFGVDGDLVYVDGADTGTNHAGVKIYDGAAGNYLIGIAVAQGNENHILICFSNYGVNSIYETVDGGNTWVSVEGNLPDMPIRYVLFDPTNPDQALVATEVGVWSTDDLNDGATDWQPTNGGLANVRVDHLQSRTSDDLLAAATHGRGMYTSTSLMDSDNDGIRDLVDLCPNDRNTALDFVDQGDAVGNTSDFVNVPHHTDLTLTDGEFTIEAWVYPTSGEEMTIVSKGDGGNSTDTEYIFSILGDQDPLFPNRLQFTMQATNGFSTIMHSQSSIPQNIWTHVAFAFEELQMFNGYAGTFYINGVPWLASTPFLPNGVQWYQSPNSPLLIGREGSVCQCDHFDGRIDEVAVWEKFLLPTDITASIAENYFGNEPDLVAYYDFNDSDACVNNGANVTLIDKTNNNHDGTLTNFGLTAGCNSNWASGHNMGTCPLDCPPDLVLTNTLNMGADYESSTYITSDQIIEDTNPGNPPIIVDYDATTEISLLEGFEVKLGVMFHAFIDGCGNLFKNDEDGVEQK